MLHCTPRPRNLQSQARPSQAPGRVPVFYLADSPGYIGSPIGLVSAPQSASVAPVDHQTQICDSVPPAFPQVQGHLVPYNQGGRCLNLACVIRSPAGKGCDRAGPSSRYEVRVCQPLLHCAQEERWVTTNLGSASFDPCASQAAIQDVDAEMHFQVRPSPRLVCSDRPEGCALSCLNHPAAGQSCNLRLRVRYVSTSSCLSGTSASWGKSKLVPMQKISFLGMK